MKIKTVCSLIAVAALAVGGLTACGTTDKESQNKLLSQAKITRADAEKTALAKVPGTIKQGEIEIEKGKLMWSFEVTPVGSKETTEVEVDAKTGEIIAVENEADEKNDKKEEKK